jgi:hypothetical protein
MIAFVKFEVGAGLAWRCQAWKNQRTTPSTSARSDLTTESGISLSIARPYRAAPPSGSLDRLSPIVGGWPEPPPLAPARPEPQLRFA